MTYSLAHVPTTQFNPKPGTREYAFRLLAHAIIERAILDSCLKDVRVLSSRLSANGLERIKKEAADFLSNEKAVKRFSLLSGLAYDTIREVLRRALQEADVVRSGASNPEAADQRTVKRSTMRGGLPLQPANFKHNRGNKGRRSVR